MKIGILWKQNRSKKGKNRQDSFTLIKQNLFMFLKETQKLLLDRIIIMERKMIFLFYQTQKHTV